MKNKKMIYGVLLLMVISLAATGGYYWYENANYVKTEDAHIDADIVKVSPQVAGQIAELAFEEGDEFAAGDILGRLSDVALPPGGNYDLINLRAPIDGMIIKKTGHVGEIASPGQAVAMMADLDALYVTANIEETDLAKIKVGQAVDFSVDAVPGSKFHGRVLSLGEATASTFSLLPTSNSSGNFTKVVQRIPIKISIDDASDKRLLPGMNVVVKIHLR